MFLQVSPVINKMTSTDIMVFSMFILQEKTQKTLYTIRYKTFANGAYFEKNQQQTGSQNRFK